MPGHADQLPRYLHLREVGRKVADTLVRRLPKDAGQEGGKKLGILQRGTLVFGSEEEIVILMDYCIHDIRRQDRNTVEEFLAESPYPSGSDEGIFLEALKDAVYSLFLIEEVEPGVGILVRDLLRRDTRFIMDVGLSQTGEPGTLFAGRVHCPENLWMTTGALLPISLLPEKDRNGLLQEFARLFQRTNFDDDSPEEASNRTAAIIRGCLKRGAESKIHYGDPPPRAAPGLPRAGGPRIAPATNLRARVGRNDPCPCGSGKKFKTCCGSKRR